MIGKKLLVGGGTGFVGKHLIKELVLKKKLFERSLILTRGDSQKEKTSFINWLQREEKISLQDCNEKLEFINYSYLSDENAIKDQRVDACVNLAGASVGTQRWTSDRVKVLYDSRIIPAKQILQFMHSQSEHFGKPSVIIGTSAVGFYPSFPDRRSQDFIFDEENYKDTDPQDPICNLCKSIEDTYFVDSLKKSGKNEDMLKRYVVRPGVVLGHDGGVYQQMLLPYILRVHVTFGTGNQIFPVIHVNDLVNLYEHIIKGSLMDENKIEKEDVLPLQGDISIDNRISINGELSTRDQSGDKSRHIFNAVMPNQYTFAQFSKILREKAYEHRKSILSSILKPSIGFPVPIPQSLASLLFGKEPAKLMCEGQAVTPAKALQTGFKFQYDTLEKSIDELLQHPIHFNFK